MGNLPNFSNYLLLENNSFVNNFKNIKQFGKFFATINNTLIKVDFFRTYVTEQVSPSIKYYQTFQLHSSIFLNVKLF